MPRGGLTHARPRFVGGVVATHRTAARPQKKKNWAVTALGILSGACGTSARRLLSGKRAYAMPIYEHCCAGLLRPRVAYEIAFDALTHTYAVFVFEDRGTLYGSKRYQRLTVLERRFSAVEPTRAGIEQARQLALSHVANYGARRRGH